jgi:hypothetical protein
VIASVGANTTLREEYIGFEPKAEDMTGCLKTLVLWSVIICTKSNTIRVIKSVETRWTIHVAHE